MFGGREEIRNRKGIVIAVKREYPGGIDLYDAKNNLIAKYSSANNATYSKTNTMLCKGNLIERLIPVN